MSGFSGLYIGLSALRAQQTVQETVAQNIANVNTEGYSRRVATLAPVGSLTSIQGIQTGMGVKVNDVRRSSSLMLNQQIQEEKGVGAYWDTTAEGMERLEGLFQEPGDNGLAALMNEFWSSWQDLSLDPSSTGARTNVQQRGQILVDTIKRTHTGILDFHHQPEYRSARAGRSRQCAGGRNRRTQPGKLPSHWPAASLPTTCGIAAICCSKNCRR